MSEKECETRDARHETYDAPKDHCIRRVPRPASRVPLRGFTLVELVVAISLAGIVVVFAAMFIVTPVKSYQAQARRAELVDTADSILRLVGRDVRTALPNSIRVMRSGSVVALELLAVTDAVRYRDSGTNDSTQELSFASPDTSFATLSQFDGITRPYVTSSNYLSIYNVGVPGADAYSLSNVITPVGTQIRIDNNRNAGGVIIAGEDLVTLSPAFKFAYGSPGRRVYLVSGPVKYLCDESANTIRRFSNYAIANTLTTTAPSSVGVVSATVGNNITACQFDYVAGTSMRAGLATLRVTISKDGESIWLVHQVHVENAP